MWESVDNNTCIVYVHCVGVIHYYRLKVFENRVIRKVSRRMEEKVTGRRTSATRSVLAAKYSNDQTRGGACDTNGREEKFIQGFGGKVSRKETTWYTQA